MAYLTPEDDEQKKQAEGEHPLLAGFGQGSAGAASTPNGPAKAPQASSNFVPFSAYANANQGGAKLMASSLAGDVDRDAAGAQLGVANERNKFVDQVHAGSPYYKSPADSIGAWRSGGLGAQDPSTAPSKKFTAGQPGPATAKAGVGSTYAGPTEFSLSQGARDASTRAAEQLANSGDDYGRQALLQKKYGGGGYTAGESRLDAALAGSAAGGQFDALRAKYGDLVGQMGEAELGANRVAASAKGTTDSTTKANTDHAAWAAERNKLDNKPFDPSAPADSFSARWYAAHPGDRTKKNFWDDSAMDYDGFMKTPGGLARDYRPEQNAFRATFGGNTAAAKAVFDSLTQEEFDNLKKMNQGTWAADSNNADEQVKQWLRARAHDLGVDPTGMAIGQVDSGTLTSLVGGA